MKKSLLKANQQIVNHQREVDNTYKPLFHFTAPIGWINDPNGFNFDGKYYHLFYQYYPYDSKWGPMHWGHAISSDLIVWKHLPVALAPSEKYDQSGVFSGTALLKNDEMRLYYTGHVDIDGQIEQSQCLAVSTDKLNFTKYKKNPLIDKSMMPEDSVFEDFRDPKVLFRNGKYIMLTGSRTKGRLGQILIHTSLDGLSFKYANRWVFPREYGDVIECPDLLSIDNQDVLIFSTQRAILNDFVQNSFSVFAWIGTFDDSKFTFIKKHEQVLDYGFDFYAPETTFNGNENVMIAWMNSWERTQITDVLKHKWAGSMSIPRKLKIENNSIIQTIPKTIEDKLNIIQTEAKVIIKANELFEIKQSKVMLLKFSLQMHEEQILKIECFKSNQNSFDITFDGLSRTVTLDRSKAKHVINSNVEVNIKSREMEISREIDCTILIDVSSIEMIINGKTMSSLYYGETTGTKITLSSNTETELTNLNIRIL